MLLEPPITSFVPGKVHDQSFLNYFREFSDRRTDAAKSFVEMAGLFCLSSVAKNMSIITSSIKPVQANDYFMIIAPPAVGRKGTIGGFVRSLLSEYGRNGENPVLPDLNVSASGSMESILSNLEHNNGYGYTIADEFATQIKQYTGNHYMSSLPGKFISAWDGSPIMHSVRSEEKSVNIRNPYYTMFTDLQPNVLRNCMNGELVANGFFARFLVSLDQTHRMKRMSPITDEDMLIFEYARNTLGGIYSKLMSSETPFIAKFDDDAFSIWSDYSTDFKNRDLNGEVSSFYTRCQNHLERISALYALNDWNGDDIIPVTIEHVEAAKQIVHQSIVSWENFFPFIARNEMELKVKITKFLLKKAGDDGLTPRNLISQCIDVGRFKGLARSDLYYFVDSCNDEDGLEIESNGQRQTPAWFIKTFDGNYDMIKLKLRPLYPEDLVNYDDVS